MACSHAERVDASWDEVGEEGGWDAPPTRCAAAGAAVVVTGRRQLKTHATPRAEHGGVMGGGPDGASPQGVGQGAGATFGRPATVPHKLMAHSILCWEGVRGCGPGAPAGGHGWNTPCFLIVRRNTAAGQVYRALERWRLLIPRGGSIKRSKGQEGNPTTQTGEGELGGGRGRTGGALALGHSQGIPRPKWGRGRGGVGPCAGRAKGGGGSTAPRARRNI